MTSKDDPSSAEMRAADEASVKYSLDLTYNVLVDFADLPNVRDSLEQGASSLKCSNPEQQKAVNEYLHTIQQPDVKADTLVYETNKLVEKFGATPGNLPYKSDDQSPRPIYAPNDNTLRQLKLTTEGVAAHYDLVNTATGEGFEKTVLNGIEKTVDRVANAIFSKPPSGLK